MDDGLVRWNKLLIVFVFVSPLFGRAADVRYQLAVELYGKALESVVVEGQVDYQKLAKKTDEVRTFLKAASLVDHGDYARWSAGDQLAFLINVYNAAVLNLVVDHFPVTGVDHIRVGSRTAFKAPLISMFDQTLSLDQLENEWIRKMGDPRIHFALVCAARSCPSLRCEPYVGDRLDQQLSEQTQQFLLDPSKNRRGKGDGLLELSAIFKWFRADFDNKFGSIENFLLGAGFIPSTPQKWTIEYLDYDWRLNDAASRKEIRQ